MELLLSPKAYVPALSWQHRCIIHCLLTRKQPQEALRYLQWARPAVETTDDAKLFADVLIQSRYYMFDNIMLLNKSSVADSICAFNPQL